MIMRLTNCLMRSKRVTYVSKDDEFQPKSAEWRDCRLGLSEICDAELVPDALLDHDQEVRLAWLRSQVIGANGQISTPFGKRELAYADFTASSRCLLHLEKFIQQYVMPYYGNTHTKDSFVGDRTSRMLHESNRYIKQCMGATEDDALIFCGSGTTAAIKRLQEVMALNIPSILRERVLATLGTKERWVVYVGPFEHHSNILSWRQSLAEVIEVPLDEQGLIDIAFLRKALENPKYSGRPKLGSFSACSNVTGIMTDTRQIARLLHEHNALACFDFAASGAHTEIDMRSCEVDGYDAVFLSPHKFLGGPGTPGLLLINQKIYLLNNSAPSTAGGGVVNFVNSNEEDTLYLRDIESREDAGTPAILQRIKASLVFWIKEEMKELIEIREQYFITTALKRLSKNPNVHLLGNLQAKRAAILSFLVYVKEQGPTPPQYRKILQARFIVILLDDLFGIQARGGCSCAGPYGHALLDVNHTTSLKFREAIQEGYEGVGLGWARLSFAYFLSFEDFDFILSAIEFIADFGQRFIRLYKFDWHSGDWTMKQDMFTMLRKASMKMKNFQRKQQVLPSITEKRMQYLQDARAMATALPNLPRQGQLPKFIDPELANFQF